MTESNKQIVKLGEKGCQGLREASIDKGIDNMARLVDKFESSPAL